MIKKYKDHITESIFFLIVFITSINPLSDFDVWFHLKSGEIISKLGIIHHDVFAYTTQGREWTPYEWLFQLVIYLWSTLFGTNSVSVFVAILATTLVFIFHKMVRKVFDVNILPALSLSFIFFSSIFEFISPRPQIIAYTFFTVLLYLILAYFSKKKNYLWICIPITIAWTNMHGSIFLAPLFLGGFSLISFINRFALKNKEWIVKARTFLIFTLLTIALSVLPPLGTIQYKLLVRFYENRELITRFIAEWAPLSADPIPFYFYILVSAISISAFCYVVIKTKSLKNSLWGLPLIGLTLSAFLATRNAFYGYLGMGILLAFCLSKFKYDELSKKTKNLVLVLTVIILAFFIWLLKDKKMGSANFTNYYPIKATKFIKDKKISGNMFNEYGFGGYLLYNLYPNQKVYFDGRTDLYLCCEMPDTLDLSYKKNLSDQEYKKVLDNLWNKNKISFVLLRTEKNTVLRKIERILQSDHDWSLVFWDDVSVIFARRDGKNDNLIKLYGTQAATPYNKDPYKKGTEEQAFTEYKKMISIADSSKSRNTLGYLYLARKDFANAKYQFEKAISVYPYNESPYMNLAEISFSEGDVTKAISLYKKAQKLAPDRGLVYLRLGQLMLSIGDTAGAKSVWEQGVANTSDSQTKQKLIEILNSI